ncbi:hypothetical protein CLOM_g13030 [Closterium sp. NIES-68]|nr:hypothetical protein CLOM_g13030 [Closterium sp. NIES-68]GJP72164.1 hypothetical protein CLOP_g2919 [Closterium sp. NIES-67]
MEILSAIDHGASQELRRRVDESMDAIHRTLTKYRPNEIAFSFNGGKDSTVILHLLRAAMACNWPSTHLHRCRSNPELRSSCYCALSATHGDGCDGCHDNDDDDGPFAPHTLSSSSDCLLTPPLQGRVARSEDGEYESGGSISMGTTATLDDDAEAEVGTEAETEAEVEAEGKIGGAPDDDGWEGEADGLCAIFFRDKDSFAEVDGFTFDMARRYGLALLQTKEGFKEGVMALQRKRPVKAIFLGVRINDPKGKGQQVFAESSPGWPPFMRVNVILNWTYRDVWEFLLLTRVPYCSLYDEGYTSIGGVSDTEPNSALRKASSIRTLPPGLCPYLWLLAEATADQGDRCRNCPFLPAYCLTDESLERAGRHKKDAPKEQGAGKTVGSAPATAAGDPGKENVGEEVRGQGKGDKPVEGKANGELKDHAPTALRSALVVV